MSFPEYVSTSPFGFYFIFSLFLLSFIVKLIHTGFAGELVQIAYLLVVRPIATSILRVRKSVRAAREVWMHPVAPGPSAGSRCPSCGDALPSSLLRVASTDPETGEVFDPSPLLAELDKLEHQLSQEQDKAAKAIAALQAQLDARDNVFTRDLPELRLKCRLLEDRLATATAEGMPDGTAKVRGRIVVPSPGLVCVIPDGGTRPFRLRVPQGWGDVLPVQTGDLAVVEARLEAQGGWYIWRASVEASAASLAPLDPTVVEACRPRPKPAGVPEELDELKRAAGESHQRYASHNVSALQYFLTFTRYRRGVATLTEPQAADLKVILGEVAHSIGWGRVVALEFENSVRDTDHCHVALIECDPTVCVSDAVRRIKSTSSKRFKAKYPKFEGPLWSAGYFAASAGGGSIDAVKRYIEKGVPQEADADDVAS